METLGVEKLRVASFLQHFFWVTDFREPWRGRRSAKGSVAADRLRRDRGGL